MATRHISPAANGEGGLGRPTKKWGEIHGVTITQNGNQVVDVSNFSSNFQSLGGVTENVIIGDTTLRFVNGILMPNV